MLKQNQTLDRGLGLYFTANTNALPPYTVYWKVKNRGNVAKSKDMIRGELTPSRIPENALFHYEETEFNGDHFVECFIIKNGVCIARNKIKVPIRVKQKI